MEKRKPLPVTFSAGERAAIDAAANAAGLKVSHWVRWVALQQCGYQWQAVGNDSQAT